MDFRSLELRKIERILGVAAWRRKEPAQREGLWGGAKSNRPHEQALAASIRADQTKDFASMEAKRERVEEGSVGATQGHICCSDAQVRENRFSTHFADCPPCAAAETMDSSMRARSAG